MTRAFPPRRWALIAIQLLLAVVAFAMLALSPPARGRFLIVPVTATATSRLAAIALAHGAAMIARGPLPGSLIVAGDREKLQVPLRAARIIMIAAPAAGCGGGR